MPVFGKTAAQHQVDREAQSDDVWIKGFQEGATKIRILDEPDDMITVRMHYDEGKKVGFPCTEERDSCIGCTSPSTKTQDKNRQYIFNALDKNGQIGLYRIGGRLWRTLSGRQQRSPQKTITDRDLEIIRTGKGMNDTTYDIEPGDRYEIDLSEVTLYDIGQVLADKYEAATKALTELDADTAAQESEKVEQAAQPAAESNGRIGVAKKETAPKKAAGPKNQGLVGAAATTPQQEEAPWDKQEELPANAPDEGDEGQQEATDSQAWKYQEPGDMSTVDLRDYLQQAGIEFPPNAVRSKLVKLAEKWKADGYPTS